MPVQVSLRSSPTLQQIDTNSQLGVFCKFTDWGLNPFIQIISEGTKEDWPQHGPLRDPTGAWPQLDAAPFTTALHWCLAMQTVPNPAQRAPVQATGCQLIQECAVGDSVKGLAEVQIDSIHSLSSIHQLGHLVIKADQAGQTQSTPPKPVLTGSDTLAILSQLETVSASSYKVSLFCVIKGAATRSEHQQKGHSDVIETGVKVSSEPDTYSLINNVHVIEFYLKPVEKE
ncbi:hypothetical protein DUI87_11902 [Hirundo rustica rustica]|uniref:Uncharacterized protein n=1 Tax=Hirundo rustica rustica TaxID=333673 RepID=A0A3M0KXD2_HIRRU|nr:hypothetical protein DUI87_11902 [Hirundo rustica rustica]